MRSFKISLVLISICLFVFACTQAENTNRAPANSANTIANGGNTAANASPAATADELASARKTFTQTCAKCHKEDGTGGKTEIEGKTIDAEDLTTEKMKKESDEELFKYISEGIPGEGMPAFKGKLSEQEIRDVVKFIRAELQK